MPRLSAVATFLVARGLRECPTDALTPAVGRGQPTATDHRNQNIAGTHHFFYGFNEVNAGVEGVNVHEVTSIAIEL
jgi:hypothetical protein